MYIPDPTFMDLVPWTDAVNYTIGQYTNVSEMQGTDWQAWGCIFYNSPSLGALNPPNPYDFDDWITWGQQLALSLQNASGAAGSGGSGGGTSATTRNITDQHSFQLCTQQYQTIVTQ